MQTLRDVAAGRLDLDEPIALTLARRQSVGSAVTAELRFADGRNDPSSFTVRASDGQPVDVERGLATAGSLTASAAWAERDVEAVGGARAEAAGARA